MATHPRVLARESQGQSPAGYSPGGRKELDMTEQININNCSHRKQIKTCISILFRKLTQKSLR